MGVKFSTSYDLLSSEKIKKSWSHTVWSWYYVVRRHSDYVRKHIYQQNFFENVFLMSQCLFLRWWCSDDDTVPSWGVARGVDESRWVSMMAMHLWRWDHDWFKEKLMIHITFLKDEVTWLVTGDLDRWKHAAVRHQAFQQPGSRVHTIGGAKLTRGIVGACKDRKNNDNI